MRFMLTISIIVVLTLGACSLLLLWLWEDLEQVGVRWQEIEVRFENINFLAKIGLLLKTEPVPEPDFKKEKSDSENNGKMPPPPNYPLSGSPTVTDSTPPSFYQPPQTPASSPQPQVSIDTKIVLGPKEGEIIEETNKISFEFESEIYPEETNGQILFETKIEGIENEWKRAYYNKRDITLTEGPGEYTFSVRAKIRTTIDGQYKTFVDPTPAQRTFRINISPYFGKITISRVQGENFSGESLIELRTNLKEEEEINITGWSIEEKRGASFTIPQGITKYRPSSQSTRDIFVQKGDRIYLSSAENPLGRDNNFRPNKCFGYLTNNNDFEINIYSRCPSINSYNEDFLEEISHLEPYCQEFIIDKRGEIARCETPNYEENTQVVRDEECVSYIQNNFTYKGCFKNHSSDDDFLKSEWHIYTRKDIVKGKIGIFYLRDKNGLFVDKYIYRSLY